MLDHQDLANRLIPLMVEVGRLQLGHYRRGVKIETKADKSPVTAADRESEAAIKRVLEVLEPDTPIIAEEAASDGNLPEISERFFLVDPLDGTREFINDRDEFTVNIGLIENGQPVFGIVYAPALARLYVTVGAEAAVAARLDSNSAASSLADLETERLRARKVDFDGLTVVASRSHSDEATETILAGYNVAERRGAGSSLKFCLIAGGEADFYPRPGRTMEWDTCAGHGVLNATGGSVTTLDGGLFSYGKRDCGFANTGFQAWGRR